MSKEIFRNKNFMTFMSGQCFAFTGNWMQKVALQWTVYQMTKSSLTLGLVGVFQYVPILLLSLFMGTFADRFPKRAVLIVTQTILLFQSLALAALIYFGHLRIWHIYMLSLIQGIVTSFEFPVRHSFQGELAERHYVVDAIAVNWTASNIARVAGPAVAGLCLDAFGAAACFLLNGLSNLIAIGGILPIKSYNAVIRREKKSVFTDTLDGFRYILSNVNLSHAALSVLLVGLFANNTEVILPVFADTVLGQSASGYSMMVSAIGIGSLVASGLFMFKGREMTRKLMTSISAFALSVALIILCLTRAYLPALAVLGCIGLFQTLSFTIINSTLQLYSTDEYRSRAMCVYSFVCIGTSPVGNLLTGLTSQGLGTAVTYAINGIVTILLLIPVQIRSIVQTNRKEREKT